MLLSNITRRVREVPNYLKAKVKGKPFHWTMTQKQLENKTKRFENMYLKERNKTRKSHSRRNTICNSLESLGVTNSNKYKNTYKKYCLTNENVNVNQVNLDRLAKNLRVGNANFVSPITNLPLIPKPLPVKSKTEEELLIEQAEKNLNVRQAMPYTESRANRIARLLQKGTQERSPLTLNELTNVTNWYSQRPKKTKKGGKSKKQRKH
jgi:hypothetical protein